MIDRDPTKLTVEDWIAELGEDESGSGEDVPLSVVVESLHATAVRIAARKAAGPPRKVARGP